MDSVEKLLNDNEYQILSNTLYGKENLKRKSDLNFSEMNTCLVSHVIKWIYEIGRA